MHWCQINHDCTFVELHEVNTNESLESWGGEGVVNRCHLASSGFILWVVMCLLSIAIAVTSGMQQKKEKERSQ